MTAPPVGGAAGIGGTDGDDGVDEGAAASGGSSPAVDAGGTAGQPATGGMNGSDGGGIDASTGGVGGTAGDGTTGDSVPGPGEAYGPCRDDGSCDLPFLCAFDATTGGFERYCAALCNGNGIGLTCPRHPTGRPAFCLSNFCQR